jgi:hypothetical protein
MKLHKINKEIFTIWQRICFNIQYLYNALSILVLNNLSINNFPLKYCHLLYGIQKNHTTLTRILHLHVNILR